MPWKLLMYLLLSPFASMPMKTSEPISEVSITYGASLAYRNFEFYKIYHLILYFFIFFFFLASNKLHRFPRITPSDSSSAQDLSFKTPKNSMSAMNKKTPTHREHIHRQLRLKSAQTPVVDINCSHSGKSRGFRENAASHWVRTQVFHAVTVGASRPGWMPTFGWRRRCSPGRLLGTRSWRCSWPAGFWLSAKCRWTRWS